MTGKLAVSKSGHDKGHLFVIVGEDDRYVFLADGVLKTVERPKKKNRKHVQVIERSPEDCGTYFGPEYPSRKSGN